MTSSLPDRITVGPDGDLRFVEFGANKIGVVTPAGTIDHEFPIPTSSARAVAIVTGSGGSMWFTLANLGTVGKLVFQWLHLPLVER